MQNASLFPVFCTVNPLFCPLIHIFKLLCEKVVQFYISYQQCVKVPIILNPHQARSYLLKKKTFQLYKRTSFNYFKLLYFSLKSTANEGGPTSFSIPAHPTTILLKSFTFLLLRLSKKFIWSNLLLVHLSDEIILRNICELKGHHKKYTNYRPSHVVLNV